MNMNHHSGRERLSTGKWILLLLTVFLMMSVAAILFAKGPSQGMVARVYRDGELLRTIPLSDAMEPVSFHLAFGDMENEVYAGPEGVCMKSANCPDQVCVRQGWLRSERMPIVCLPHRITIALENAPDEEELDAISR